MGEDYFKEQLTNAIEEETLLDRKFNFISTARLVVFIALLIAFYIRFFNKNKIAGVFGFALLLIFFFLLYFHNKVEGEKEYIQSKKVVLEKYIDRFSNQWKEFKEDGSKYLTEKIPQTIDLDLFGKASLYQYICVAHTSYGRDMLAKSLCNYEPDREGILRRQEAVKELVSKKEFSMHIQTLSHLLEKEQKINADKGIEKFIQYGEDKTKHFPKWIRFFTWGLPIITIIFIGLFAMGLLPLFSIYACVGLQFGFAVLGNRKNKEILGPLYSFSRNIEAYRRIFEALEKEKFTSEYLNMWQKELTKGEGATKGIKALNSIGEAVNLRYSPIIYAIACGTLMWDYQCAEALESWKSTYGSHIRNWMKAVGEIESLLSLGVICSVKDNYSFPSITQSHIPRFKAEEIFHPLINEKQVVANSLELQAQTCIITGSNMSGKTTFLRSIGVNMALAYAGGPVCAKNFETTCMALFTSMRIQDDVSQGISTFYAELLRIKTMVQYSVYKRPMLLLIDEIFKGTNSADRIIGAKETIKKLSQSWIISMISTHDFELCELSDNEDVRAVNYHFSEYYIDDEIHFDYIIKKGRCETTNAKHLMRMAGIL
ncbi:hypothetical protein KQI42_14640 [Tissierella sp. MSJ-40]|uniref:DNA mismatch repair proteins mutS family domain-containing protein n=1 Tax=Tissierella simiarum TaxID=2841534 RepID=A0ABS6E8K6_9FIRM|nr:MutS family DNA mismatch repair protein [Tissierella simiarum]MBU5439258.1 hypothetical protein [Tissierella simiarum]